MQAIREKLVNMLGEREATAVLDRTLAAVGIEAVESAEDRYIVGEALTREPAPVLRVIGRCVMAQALLHGARGGPIAGGLRGV